MIELIQCLLGRLFVELRLHLLLDPLVLDCFLGRDSFLWIFLHKLLNEILDFFGLVHPMLGFEFEMAVFHLSNDLFIVMTAERWPAAHHDVQNDSDAP